MIAPTSFFLDYGCHVRILEEARILQKFNHRVKIVTYPLGRNLPDLDIERTLPIPFRSSKEVGPSRSKILIDVLLTLKAFQVALKFKPQVIHAHLHEGALIGGLLSRLLRVPLVFDFQGSLTSEMIDHQFIKPNGVLSRLVRKLEWHIDRLPRSILASSKNAEQILTNDFHVPPHHVTVLSDCVDADAFVPLSMAPASRHAQMTIREEAYDQPLDSDNARDDLRPSIPLRSAPGASFLERVQGLRARLNIPPERKIVVYIGLLAEYRGTGVLLDAAARLLARGSAVHFVIVGFPNVDRYKARARDLGIADHVSFPGRVPYEDVPLWLSLGDVAVEPKMSATEAAGKVLNYMAMGLPVVAFDITVMREYLGDRGVYAPLGDVAALAHQLAALLDDPDRAHSIGRALRERARLHFSWERAGREIECVYDNVLR